MKPAILPGSRFLRTAVTIFCLTALLFNSLCSVGQTPDTTRMHKKILATHQLLIDWKYEEAISQGNELYNLLVASGDYERALNLLADISEAYWQRDMTTEADSLLDFVEESAERNLEDPRQVYVNLFRNRAASNIFKGDFESAVKNLEKALHYYELNNEKNEIIRAGIISNLGACHFHAGEYDSAARYLEKAHEVDINYYRTINKDTVYYGYVDEQNAPIPRLSSKQKRFFKQIDKPPTPYHVGFSYQKYI